MVNNPLWDFLCLQRNKFLDQSEIDLSVIILLPSEIAGRETYLAISINISLLIKVNLFKNQAIR